MERQRQPCRARMGRFVQDLYADACDHDRLLLNVLGVRDASILVLPSLAKTDVATRLAGA
jgi:hypothetical protein